MKTMSISCACLLLLAATASRAEVLIDNLGEPIRNATQIVSDFWAAQSFVTAGGASVRLDAVTLRLGVLIGSPAVVAELRADSAGSPGSLISSFGVPALDAGATRNELLGVAPGTTLLPATTYWLVMGVNGAGGLDWSYAEGNAASGSGAFGEYAYSLTQGTSWTDFGTEDPYMARIDVSAVPEPSPMMLATLGLVALTWLARRRHQPQDDRAFASRRPLVTPRQRSDFRPKTIDTGRVALLGEARRRASA